MINLHSEIIIWDKFKYMHMHGYSMHQFQQKYRTHTYQINNLQGQRLKCATVVRHRSSKV